MILWMILTVLCAAAAVMVAAPLLRRYGDPAGATAADLNVYRDQLEEVDREANAGLIDSTQADGARSEIRRRVLAADRQVGAISSGKSFAGNQTAIIGVTGIVVLGSVVLYAISGRPDLPSASPAIVQMAAPGQLASARAPVVAPQVPASGQVAAQGQPASAGSAANLGSVDEMIERIVQRLKQNPGNGDDWRMLGWSYFGTERYAEAAEAYGKAAALQPKIAALHASRGEALVRAGQGAVTPEAKAAFETTLALDAKEPRSRFFLGMAKEQAGDKAAALSDWVALVKEANPADDWVPDLRQRIAELAQQIGTPVPDVAQVAPKSAGMESLKLLKDAEPAPAAPERGPTAGDVKAADAMAPSDRTAMVRGMVEGLAARLEKSPRDADGWIKLIRSRKVLGEADAASQALRRALEIFADAPQERAQIVAAAIELQVMP